MPTTTEKALALCHLIEAAGASEQLTKCSVLASEVHTEVYAMQAVISECASSLNRYAAECFPEIENDQKHFVRVLMESWATELSRSAANSNEHVLDDGSVVTGERAASLLDDERQSHKRTREELHKLVTTIKAALPF